MRPSFSLPYAKMLLRRASCRLNRHRRPQAAFLSRQNFPIRGKNRVWTASPRRKEAIAACGGEARVRWVPFVAGARVPACRRREGISLSQWSMVRTPVFLEATTPAVELGD
jgi:hypothetical protein